MEQHKRNWIEHIVSYNAMKEQISVIFEMLSELNENLVMLDDAIPAGAKLY